MRKNPLRSGSAAAAAAISAIRSTPQDGSENSNLTVVPATLWTDFAGSNDVCVLIGSMHNNPERLALY